MDADRFDRLAQGLVNSESRRELLRRLRAIPALAALPMLLGATETEAAKHHKRRRRRRRKQQGDTVQGVCTFLDQICVIPPFGNPCCNGETCRITAGLVVTTCQSECHSTSECQQRYKTKGVSCQRDSLACPGLWGCCRPDVCGRDQDCDGGTCCNGTCCLPRQRCLGGVCAASS